MRRTLIAAIAACFAILIFAGPRPALSMPATAALPYGETNAGVLHFVKKYRYSRNWHRPPYYRGYAYGYRPYAYRPYGYYRPYAYYGYPYYYRRPGISLWFGF
jgi:hypothetical protein